MRASKDFSERDTWIGTDFGRLERESYRPPIRRSRLGIWVKIALTLTAVGWVVSHWALIAERLGGIL